jgi:hypothetical protein
LESFTLSTVRHIQGGIITAAYGFSFFLLYSGKTKVKVQADGLRGTNFDYIYYSINAGGCIY